MTPSGFSSPGGHNGFETFTHTTTGPHPTTTQERLPPGWDEGKATWKSGLQSSNPILTTRPPDSVAGDCALRGLLMVQSAGPVSGALQDCSSFSGTSDRGQQTVMALFRALANRIT